MVSVTAETILTKYKFDDTLLLPATIERPNIAELYETFLNKLAAAQILHT